MIRGILFDLFDTLVDHHPDRLESVELGGRRVSPTTPALHAHASTHGGVEATLEEFVAIQRSVDRELHAETIAQGLELPTQRRFEVLADRLGAAPGLARGLTDVHMEMLRSVVTVPTHHEPVMLSLATQYALGLCSNFSHAETARSILADAGFDRHLESVVISEEVGIRKPRREIFEVAAASLGLEPREILHVGDDLGADVTGAAELGMKTVWLTRRIDDPEAALARHDGPAPNFAVEDLMDLPVLAARLSVQA